MDMSKIKKVFIDFQNILQEAPDDTYQLSKNAGYELDRHITQINLEEANSLIRWITSLFRDHYQTIEMHPIVLSYQEFSLLHTIYYQVYQEITILYISLLRFAQTDIIELCCQIRDEMKYRKEFISILFQAHDDSKYYKNHSIDNLLNLLRLSKDCYNNRCRDYGERILGYVMLELHRKSDMVRTCSCLSKYRAFQTIDNIYIKTVRYKIKEMWREIQQLLK